MAGTQTLVSYLVWCGTLPNMAVNHMHSDTHTLYIKFYDFRAITLWGPVLLARPGILPADFPLGNVLTFML